MSQDEANSFGNHGHGGQPCQRAPRQRVLKSGLAAFNEQFSAVPCTVRNQSETGARLIFGDVSLVPRRFILHLSIDGFKVECERVWVAGNECGVRFVGERSHTPYARSQVLKPSEQALSERVMQELEMRDAAHGDAGRDFVPVRTGPRPNGPTFGRRH